jgi:hypothetical protein
MPGVGEQEHVGDGHEEITGNGGTSRSREI